MGGIQMLKKGVIKIGDVHSVGERHVASAFVRGDLNAAQKAHALRFVPKGGEAEEVLPEVFAVGHGGGGQGVIQGNVSVSHAVVVVRDAEDVDAALLGESDQIAGVILPAKGKGGVRMEVLDHESVISLK
jgi:hypothetical protein